MPGENDPGKPNNRPDHRRHGANPNRGGPQKPRTGGRGNAQGPKGNKPQDRDQRGPKPNQRDRGPRRDDRAGGSNFRPGQDRGERANRDDKRPFDKRQRPQDDGRGAPAGRDRRPDNRGQRPDGRGQRFENRGQRSEGRGQRSDDRRPRSDGPRSDNRGARPDHRGARPDRGQRANGRGRPDDRGQRFDREQRSDRRGPRQDDRGQRTARGPRSENRGPRPDARGQRPDDRRRQDGPPHKHGGRAQDRPGDRGRPERGPKQGDERPQRPQRERENEPELPPGATADELHGDVRRELRSMPKNLADAVAAHLAAAGQLMEEEPEKALEHARYARRRASRVAAVREANGLTAYHNGEWSEALSELRAARRMSGDPSNLPVLADCERALGRPQRALEVCRDPESPSLDRAEAVELTIVAAGARRDLGQIEAAVVALQLPELESQEQHPWNARLFYAYADNLLAAGRVEEAFTWFVHAADADDEGETDAPERLDELFVQLGGDSGIDELLSGGGDVGEDDASEDTAPAVDGSADPDISFVDRSAEAGAQDSAESLAGGATEPDGATEPSEQHAGSRSDDAANGSDEQ